jgi:hypothetical protein
MDGTAVTISVGEAIAAVGITVGTATGMAVFAAAGAGRVDADAGWQAVNNKDTTSTRPANVAGLRKLKEIGIAHV